MTRQIFSFYSAFLTPINYELLQLYIVKVDYYCWRDYTIFLLLHHPTITNLLTNFLIQSKISNIPDLELCFYNLLVIEKMIWYGRNAGRKGYEVPKWRKWMWLQPLGWKILKEREAMKNRSCEQHIFILHVSSTFIWHSCLIHIHFLHLYPWSMKKIIDNKR